MIDDKVKHQWKRIEVRRTKAFIYLWRLLLEQKKKIAFILTDQDM